MAVDAGQEALLVRLFADFLLARQRLLEALDPECGEPLRPALSAACVSFFELAQELLPSTPEDILVVLTKNIVLNACRATCLAHDNAWQAEREPASGRIIEMLRAHLEE